MTDHERAAHPYIPNSVPKTKAEMLDEVGLRSAKELHNPIPDRLRLQRDLRLPASYPSEYDLKRHVRRMLSANKTCEENLSFLGGGCWQHYVPAVCDEINRRAEFLTAYAGETYSDHGRHQAFFEYASMIGELVGMDAVSLPTYDWANAASTALRMAARLTGRREVLIPRTMGLDKLLTLRNYAKPDLAITLIDDDSVTGQIDLAQLQRAISPATAAIYVENPSYFGAIQVNADRIAQIAHDAGALSVVGVDPISLGVLAAPADYGADIVCGELQPLGMHMQFGGGLAGFIASSDDPRYIREYPLWIIGMAPTSVPGEFGYGHVAFDRTSYIAREHGKEFGGTSTCLWAITAAVYLSLMGPQGLRELGEGIMQRSRYAMATLSQIQGVKIPMFQAPVFKEFVVNFDETGRTVAEVNRALLEYGIFGGKDLSLEFPEIGNSALFSVTEVHSKADIDRLAESLTAIVA